VTLVTTEADSRDPPDEDARDLLLATAAEARVPARRGVRLNDYYEGEQALVQLGLAIPPELQHFSVILNWPRVTVDGCEQRLDVVGFRLGSRTPPIPTCRQLWQYNDLDEQQSFAHTDALALGRSFLCLGTNPTTPTSRSSRRVAPRDGDDPRCAHPAGDRGAAALRRGERPEPTQQTQDAERDPRDAVPARRRRTG
jgi:hypothetical protein